MCELLGMSANVPTDIHFSLSGLIPRGGDQIQVGDNVIVVTLEHGLHDLRDIVEE